MAKKRPNGDGTIRKRTDGRWEGRVIIGHKEDGKPIIKTVTSKTQKELVSKMHRVQNDYDGVNLNEKSDMKMEDWCKAWLRDYAEPNLRPSTYQGYKSVIYIHIIPELGNKPVRFISSADINKFYINLKRNGRKQYRKQKGKGLSDATVYGAHLVLHEMLEFAVRARMIAVNPCDGAFVPKCNYAPKKILSEGQLETFMKAISQEPLWYEFFYTEITTGLRRGEICGLKWEDIDFVSSKMHIRRNVTRLTKNECVIGETKTATGMRDILLPPSTLHMLKARRERSSSKWIFPSFFDNNVPIAPNLVYKKLKGILQKADLPDIRFHDLRHTFATHALANGVDAKTLSGILGHTNASFTLDTYTHVTSDMHKQARDIVGEFMNDITGGDDNGKEA